LFPQGDSQKVEVTEVYDQWILGANQALQNVSVEDFAASLEEQLDILIDRMNAADPQFRSRVAVLRRAFVSYSTARDDLLREIQSHRASFEYTNEHAQNQPSTSILRFIYSHQPTKSPTLLTANAALTWYNTIPAGVATNRLRNVQLSGQLDRRLGEIPSLGNAVATFGVYYQWMKEDALIMIGPGNVAPGGGIVLPNTAATLLGTKGSIGVVQGKLTIPFSGIVKVPISVTWSNRTELINESDVRGQVGLTFDIDSLFK
jgi:hypothetical protein